MSTAAWQKKTSSYCLRPLGNKIFHPDGLANQRLFVSSKQNMTESISISMISLPLKSLTRQTTEEQRQNISRIQGWMWKKPPAKQTELKITWFFRWIVGCKTASAVVAFFFLYFLVSHLTYNKSSSPSQSMRGKKLPALFRVIIEKIKCLFFVSVQSHFCNAHCFHLHQSFLSLILNTTNSQDPSRSISADICSDGLNCFRLNSDLAIKEIYSFLRKITASNFKTLQN